MITPWVALGAGLIAGFAIAMPVGAIAVMVLRSGITYGLKSGVAAGLGAATVDFTYAALAILAGSAVSTVVATWGDIPLYVSGAVIVGIGIHQLVVSLRSHGKVEERALPSAKALYARFVMLTAINPATIVYFVGLSGFMAGQQASSLALAAFVLGAGGASALWHAGLGSTGAVLHRAASPRAGYLLSVAGSVIVIVLGVAMIVHAATS